MMEKKKVLKQSNIKLPQQNHNNNNYENKSRYNHEEKEFPSFTIDTVTVICYDAYETIINSLKKTTYDNKLTYDKQSTYETKLTYDLKKVSDSSWLHSRMKLHNQLLLLISMLFKTFNLSNPYQVMIDYDVNTMMNNNKNNNNDHNHHQYDDDDDGVSLLVTLSHIMKTILMNNNSVDYSEDIWKLIKDPFKSQLLLQIFTQNPSLQSGLLLCILLKHISSILGISKMTIFLSSMFHISSHNDSNNNDETTTIASSNTLATCILTFVSFLSFTPNSDVVYPILLWFISCITLHPLPLPQVVVVGDDDDDHLFHSIILPYYYP